MQRDAVGRRAERTPLRGSGFPTVPWERRRLAVGEVGAYNAGMSDALPPLDAPAVTTMEAPRRRAALGFIFATALMDVISLGIVIPVLPGLVKQLAGGSTSSAALWVGLFGTVWSLMQFVFSPLLGVLSDRFGRRPVILVSIFGLALDYVLMALAPSLAWLLVGRIIHGITAASFSTAGAYIADITPPQDRAKRFGIMGAAWGAGFVLGPALGGFLGAHHLRLPFWVAAGMALVNAIYGIFVLPESLPKDARTPFALKRANPIGAFALLRSHTELLGLAGVLLLLQLAHQVFPSIFVLYSEHRYGWTPRDVGVLMAATGVSNMVVQGLLVGPIVKRVGERRAVLIGLAFACAGFAVYALAPTGFVFALGVPVFAFAGLINPGVMGLMSRNVPANAQGQLQGANSSIMGVSGLIGPLLFTVLFAWSLEKDAGFFGHPGLAVGVAAALCGLALLAALWVTRKHGPVGEAAPHPHHSNAA